MAFFEKRPWGYMIKPIHFSRFWLKFLRVTGRTSLQYHRQRDEYWFGLTKIKRGTIHRMLPGFQFELALGNPQEEDNVRVEDDYNRPWGNNVVVVAVSGGFDPIHPGHIELFREAKKLGDKLVVFLNSDEFLTRKKGKPFMTFEERKVVIESLEMVNKVVQVIDSDDTVCQTIREFRPSIFANGGDRTEKNIPELSVCEELNIQTVFSVGGGKKQSSSALLSSWKNNVK